MVHSFFKDADDDASMTSSDDSEQDRNSRALSATPSRSQKTSKYLCTFERNSAMLSILPKRKTRKEPAQLPTDIQSELNLPLLEQVQVYI